MIHAGKDDYKSDPAGNAGDRVACGVISEAAPTTVGARRRVSVTSYAVESRAEASEGFAPI